MDKEYYMRPLSSIAIEIIEAIAYKETGKLSELRKAVEFRTDALAVVGNPTEDEKRLIHALKRLTMEDSL